MRTRTAIHCATVAAVLSWMVNTRAASGTWNVDASGNWSTAGNWTPAAAPGTAAGDTVGLTFNITAARTVTMDTTSRTVGTLKIGDSGSSYFAYTLTNSGGAVLTFNNSGNGASLVQTNTTAADVIALPLTLADNLTVTNNSTLTLSGAIGGNGNITKTGTGTLMLSGANTQSGDTTVSTGSLTVSGGTFGSTSGTITVGNGAGVAGFAVTGGTATANTLNVGTIANSTGSTNSITGSASAAFASVNLGSTANTAGSMTIDTSGSVALGAFIDNRDYAAVGPGTANGLIINQGTVTADNVIIQNYGSGANLNMNGGSFTIGNSSSTGAFLIGNAASGRGGFLSMSGGSLTYLGTDGLLMATLAGTRAAAIITGGTATLTGITLNQVNVTGLTNWLTVSNGAILYLGSVGLVLNQPSAAVYAEFGTATVGATTDWSSTAPIALLGITTIKAADASSAAHNISLSGILSGSGGLTKTGAGQLTLSGANSYAGNTTISGGALKLGASNVLPNNSALVMNGGTFSSAGYSETAGALTVQASSTISLGVATTADLTFASGSYTAGTLTISNWTGTAGQSGTGDQIFITASPSAAFLNNITFAGYQTGAIRLGTGEIVPSGMLPVNLAITSVNGGFNPTYGTAFSVVVQAQDVNGNAAKVVSDTAVTLSVNTGSGALGGTLTGTITAGNSSVTISGVTYSKAESGIVLTATRTSGDSLAAGNSGAFTMNSNLSWYNSGWGYRIAITINHATVAGPLTNFPVLIVLTSSSLSQFAQTSGNDILFTAGDGTNQLAHEIESYTSASGALVAWVNVPLLSSTADTNIYLYYGNPAAANQQNAGGVWDANFQGVWHLNNSFADSTANNRAGTNTGTVNGAGEISNGRVFAPATNVANYITVSGLMGSPANVTLSAWVNLNSSLAPGTSYGEEIMTLGDCVFLRQVATNGVAGWFYNGSVWTNVQTSFNLLAAGWHHVAFAFDNVNHVQKVYVDGTPAASANYTTSIGYAGHGANTILGEHGNGQTYYNYNGTMDEVRVSSAARSANWIATEYANQSSPAAFCSLGSAQPHPAATNYFHFSATTLGANTGPVNPTNGVTSVGGAGLAAGDLVVFDGLVIDTKPGTADAWGAVELNQRTNGFYGLTLAQMGVLARYTTNVANYCQLWTNSVAAANFPAGGSISTTNRVRIELTATVAGSTTNMSWSVMIDQGLTGAFTTTLSGTGVTFTNDSIGLTFGSYVDPSLFEDYSIPAITTQPTNQTVTAGGNVTFAVAALGATPLNYQWYFNGSAVSGATSSSYSLTGAMAANAGNYTVIITNYNGSVISSVAALTVNKAAGTVTLGSLSQTYNGSARAATASTTPGGLTVNLTYNGSSSAPTNSGSYTVIGTISDANYQGSATNTLVIGAVSVTVASGLTANGKVYDGTTTATINSNNVALSGVLAGDTANVKLSTNSYTATFGTAAVGTSKAITVSGLSLTGSAAGNYTLTQPTGLTANITAKPLTAQGTLALTSKVYDRTTTANPTGAAALQSTEPAGSGTTSDGKPYSVDSVSLTGTAAYNFNSKNVASATTVTESGLSLTGTGSGNYTLTAPSLSATITALALTVTGVTANNKVYDGTTTATVNTGSAVLVGVISGDTVTLNTTGAAGTFSSASAGLGKTVTISGLTISGADAGNYSLTQPTTTANIYATIVITSSVNWSAITIGSGPGGQPSAGDTITVYDGATITVDVASAVCASIGLGTTGGGPGILAFNPSSQLTVSGGLTLGENGGSPGSFGEVVMTNGAILACQSLTAYNPNSSPSLWFPGAGTVQLTANNTLPAIVITNFNNLILPIGTTTLGAGLIVTNLTQSGGNLALGANPLTVINSHYAGTNTISGTGNYNNSGLFETARPSGVAGNLTTSGTINLAGAAFRFDGAAAQVTSVIMPGTVAGITVSNAAGVTLSQTTTTTNLTLTSGNLTVAAYQLSVAGTNNSAVSGGSGTSYVVGALQKAFGSGTNQAFTFPIGTTTAYTPVAISNLNVGGSGLRVITFQSTDGDQPQLGTSGIATNQSVNRYWTLTQSGSTFTNYTITFNYLASDLDAEAYPDDFTAQIYTNSVWSSVTVMGTPTSTSTVVTNYSAGSAVFAIGNPVSNQAITFASPGNQTYGVGPITLTATASSGLTVTYSVSGPATLTNTTLYLTGVGTVSIVASQSGNGVYGAATPMEDDILVSPKTLTVASGIIANNKTYDGVKMATISSNNIFLSGVVAGDSANVNLSTNGYTAAFASAAAGNGIGVTVSGLTLTGSAATNYTLTQPSLSANITAAPLTLTANNTNRVYGAANPSFTASYSGFVNGETAGLVQGAPGFSTTATINSPVNSYSITPSVGSLTAPNYSFTTFNNGTFTITRARSTNVVVTSANPSPTGSNVTFTATLTAVSPGSGTPTGNVQFLADGAALGAPVTLSSGLASLTTNSLAHGTHAITAQYAGDGNFFGSTNTLNPNQVINTAPVAASESLSRYPTTGVKARVTTLLANDSDPDGDAVSFVSVSATSAQSGAVVTNFGWVFYTPLAGYTNADSFSYVITDGGLQATGAVAVAIVSDTNAAQNIESSQDLGNGSFVTSFFGIPGRIYSIQYTTNLTNPVWQTLGTAAANATGWFQYTDSPGTGTPARFYRSTYP